MKQGEIRTQKSNHRLEHRVLRFLEAAAEQTGVIFFAVGTSMKPSRPDRNEIDSSAMNLAISLASCFAQASHMERGIAQTASSSALVWA
jgi:hypothetical protein